jgi:hypothetical protein
VSPLDLITVSLAETSIVCRFAGSTGRLFTHFRQSPLAIGNEGQRPAAAARKSMRGQRRIALPPAGARR